MLLEHVLPASYFDQTLRALSVDMAVLRDLMQHRLPRLSAHLDFLQRHSESEFEPPLVNVFSMQWFLTLFATCLPKRAVHRIWDSLMLEGSEILLRAALALWAKIAKRLNKCKTADSFYTQMGLVCQEWTEMSDDKCNDVMSVIYSMADFPYPGLDELRNRHMFNIQPFSSTIKLLRHQAVNILKPASGYSSDEGPDAFQSADDARQNVKDDSNDHRKSSDQKPKTSDLNALEKQYRLLRQRQKQAAVVVR
uniref:Rab-GAP TBC domain-containing protein n=1 Tax=Romanomermis culicivorax TaxID=13658 RepID=A0A915HWR2_ROMCU